MDESKEVGDVMHIDSLRIKCGWFNSSLSDGQWLQVHSKFKRVNL